jgi:hypothetical protein
MALDGDTVAVCATGHSTATSIDGDQADDNGSGNGAVYIYH